MTRDTSGWVSAAVALVGVWAWAGAAAGADAPGVTLVPADGKAITGPTPITFGMVFRPGELPANKALEGRLGGAAVGVQLDPKRRYEDGSLKHGVVSVVVAKLDAAGAALEFRAAEPGAPGPAATEQLLLAGDFDATVTFTFPDGKSVSAGARKMLAPNTTTEATGDRPREREWLLGSVATEWLLSGAPVDADGTADPDLNVEFQVRYYPATESVRVSAVIEKCSDSGSDGGLVYDVVISRGKGKPETVFEQKGVAQPDLTRWRKVFWVGKEPAGVHIRHDAKAMAAAGVIPQYDFSLKVPDATLADQWKRWEDPAKTKRGLFENGFICAYFGTTGGRADIAPLPGWTALYLLSMDPRQKAIMLGIDELGAGVPIHGRERGTGRVISYETRPKLWFADGRGGQWGTEKLRPKPAEPRTKEPVKSIFSPETAHLPSFSYVSYAVTGDYFFLEECYFWAGYVVLSGNPGYSKGTIYSGQLRGCAWGLRTVAHTAGLAPDGDPEKEQLAKRVVFTLKSYIDGMKGPNALPLGLLVGGSNANAKLVYAPWQHDYMIMAVDSAAEAGFKDAETLRSMLLDFSMGRFTHAPDFDPQYGCGYWWVFEDTKSTFKVTTWKELFERNCAGEGPDAKRTVAGMDNPGSYSDLALAAAAIGVRTGYPKAKEVYDFLMKNLKSIPARRAGSPSFAYAAEKVK